MKGGNTIRAKICKDRHLVPIDWNITGHGFRHTRTGRETTAAKDLRAAARWLGVSVDRDSLRTRPSRMHKS